MHQVIKGAMFHECVATSGALDLLMAIYRTATAASHCCNIAEVSA